MKRTQTWRKLLSGPSPSSFSQVHESEIPAEALQNILVDIDRSVSSKNTHLGRDLQKEAREYNVARRKEELKNVLIAFAKYNTVIGYCQGLSYYVDFLLQFFPPEDAFLMLSRTIQTNCIEGLFDKSLSLVSRVLEVHNKVLNLTLPEFIRKNIHKLSSGTHDYAAGWYLTLFSRLPPPLYAEILDFFYPHGFCVLFYAGSALVEVGYYTYIAQQKREVDEQMQILFKLVEYPIPEHHFSTVFRRNMQMVSIEEISKMMGIGG